jgi:hypothetical protein
MILHNYKLSHKINETLLHENTKLRHMILHNYTLSEKINETLLHENTKLGQDN